MEIEYIKSLKQAKNVTVKELSNLTNIPESTITNILNRRTENPSFEIVSKLVIALGGSLDALAGAERKEKEGEDVTALIATVTRIYENQIKNERKDKFALFALLSVVLVIVFAVLTVDLLHGGIGWFRY